MSSETIRYQYTRLSSEPLASWLGTIFWGGLAFLGVALLWAVNSGEGSLWLDYQDFSKTPPSLLDVDSIVRQATFGVPDKETLPLLADLGLWLFGRAFPLIVVALCVFALIRARHFFQARHDVSAKSLYATALLSFVFMSTSLSGLVVFGDLPLSSLIAPSLRIEGGGALGAEIVSLLQWQLGPTITFLLLFAGAVLGVAQFFRIHLINVCELIGHIVDKLHTRYIRRQDAQLDRSLGEVLAQAREMTISAQRLKPELGIDIVRTSRAQTLFDAKPTKNPQEPYSAPMPNRHASNAVIRPAVAQSDINTPPAPPSPPNPKSNSWATQGVAPPTFPAENAVAANTINPAPIHSDTPPPRLISRPIKYLSTPQSPLNRPVPLESLIAQPEKSLATSVSLPPATKPSSSVEESAAISFVADEPASKPITQAPISKLSQPDLAPKNAPTAVDINLGLTQFINDLSITPSPKPPSTINPPTALSAENEMGEMGEMTQFEAQAEMGADADLTDMNPSEVASIWAPAPINFPMPPINLLDTTPAEGEPPNDEVIRWVSQQIEEALKSFGLTVQVKAAYPGPVITRYEIALANGIKSAQIVNLSKDLARILAVMSIRVVENIPGKSWIGLEVPNERRQMVKLAEILASLEFQKDPSPLSLAIGKDIGGMPKTLNLAKMPHLLVAGTTGSGKSVGINDMIISMLYKATPNEVRMVMIDPKMVELSVYADIPHLIAPVITDMKQAVGALNWCVGEMERREQLLSKLSVRNIAKFNQKVVEAAARGEPILDPLEIQRLEDMGAEDFSSVAPLSPLPYLVVIVDEFADLFMVVGKKIEEVIARLAQKGRAGGIHIILATQRPSVDVVTGLIKANVPSRIAFQVSSKIDSRTILDQQGAEALLGQGDMLYYRPGEVTQRLHGAFISDDEVNAVAEYWRGIAAPRYLVQNFEEPLDESANKTGGNINGANEYDRAVQLVMESNNPSISYLQRRLSIGFNKAAKYIEQMQEEGLISAPQKNGKRVVMAPRNV